MREFEYIWLLLVKKYCVAHEFVYSQTTPIFLNLVVQPFFLDVSKLYFFLFFWQNQYIEISQ